MKNPIALVTACLILFSSCEMADENIPVTEFEESVALKAYYDVSFSLDNSARLFSTLTGESYAEEMVDETSGPLIDLVSITNEAFIAFTSPDDEQDDYEVPNASFTAIQHLDSPITAAQFDNMVNGNLLAEMEVEADNESIGISDFKDHIIVFRNAAGEQGAIKLRMLNAERLVVDIKITQ
ncbi:hypothetical protein [Croceiramulus getboli]|nr:hypothetical protein P8624_07765 [Flavobacteriaceae bacterium YJPT1-3]